MIPEISNIPRHFFLCEASKHTTQLNMNKLCASLKVTYYVRTNLHVRAMREDAPYGSGNKGAVCRARTEEGPREAMIEISSCGAGGRALHLGDEGEAIM